MGDQLRFVDDSGDTRLAGELHDDGATVGDVLTVQSDGSLAAAAGGGSSSAVPIAALSGVTVDTTTYDDPIPDDGTKMRTVVADGIGTVLGVALQGDLHPRILVIADPGGNQYLVFGDGVIDAVNDTLDGCVVGAQDNGDGTMFFNLFGTRGGVQLGLLGTNRGYYNETTVPIQVGPSGPALSGGSGSPVDSQPAGEIGDLYFRTDGDGSLGQTIYRCTVAGAQGATTWIGLT